MEENKSKIFNKKEVKELKALFSALVLVKKIPKVRLPAHIEPESERGSRYKDFNGCPSCGYPRNASSITFRSSADRKD